MATDDKVLRSIKRGDREMLVGLSTTEIGLVYSYWYEEYVSHLKAEGKRFPATTLAIAKEVFGDDKYSQHIYKNIHIKKVHSANLKEIGQDARSMNNEVARKEVFKVDNDQLNSANKSFHLRIDVLTEEKAILVEKVKNLERDLELDRIGRLEERAAIDHLFETGRRILL